MTQIDIRGLFSPEVIFRTENEINKLEIGTSLEILTDDPLATKDIPAWALFYGHILEKTEQDGKTLKFTVKKNT